MSATEPKVAVLMGSKNDWNIMQAACDQLTALGIANEARVISAHRTPSGTTILSPSKHRLRA